MYKIELGKSGLQVPAVAVGCMRISNMNEKEVSSFINTAIENGTNFFDHADIYGGGKSEAVFGNAITPAIRDNIIIQTKCGIRPGRFDFSYEHIINSVNGKQESMDTVFPLVKKYGGVVVALTLDESGLPKTADERVRIAERILTAATKGEDL